MTTTSQPDSGESPQPTWPRVGDVWEDTDKRGGPRFVVIGFTPDGRHAWVENTYGAARRRKVRADRIAKHYRFLRRSEYPMTADIGRSEQ